MRRAVGVSSARRLGLALLLSTTAWLAAPAVATGDTALRPVDSFAEIANPAERSVALFVESGKVLTHPRCLNCHPAGDSPLQGDEGRAHEPPVARGAGGHGPVGMRCATCHFGDNFDPGGVPGAPAWHLAPLSMAWEGLSLAEICAQLKDPERNGGRDLDAIIEHMAEDALVAWAWSPGAGRSPAPGSQEVFGDLIRSWARDGAVCPSAD